VNTPENNIPDVSYAAQSITEQENQPDVSDPSSAQTEASAPNSTNVRQPLRIKLLALKPGNVYAVTNYGIQHGSVTYVLLSGAKGSVDITEVDWRKTSHLNAEPIVSSVADRTAESFSVRH
jgi:hypothetical protein